MVFCNNRYLEYTSAEQWLWCLHSKHLSRSIAFNKNIFLSVLTLAVYLHTAVVLKTIFTFVKNIKHNKVQPKQASSIISELLSNGVTHQTDKFCIMLTGSQEKAYNSFLFFLNNSYKTVWGWWRSFTKCCQVTVKCAHIHRAITLLHHCRGWRHPETPAAAMCGPWGSSSKCFRHVHTQPITLPCW